MNEIMPLAEAAKRLGVSPSTLRSWKRRGMPVFSDDETGGRNRGALVDLDAIRRWRYGDPRSAERELEELAALLTDFLRMDSGYSEPPCSPLDRGLMIPPHRLAGISEGQLARVLLLLWRYAHIRKKGEEPAGFPDSMLPILVRAKNATRAVEWD